MLVDRILYELGSLNQIFFSLPIPTIFILLPVCSALTGWWPSHDTPGSWSFYVNPGFTACIPFLGTGLLRAAIPVTGATRAGSAPRPHSLPGPDIGRTREDKLSLQCPCRWPQGPYLSLTASQDSFTLLHKTASHCFTRQLCALLYFFV